MYSSYMTAGTVWWVEAENSHEQTAFPGILAISANAVIILNTQSRQVTFGIPCSTVIGWSLHQERLKLYYGDGDCVCVQEGRAGKAEDLQDISLRLQCVTRGIQVCVLSFYLLW